MKKKRGGKKHPNLFGVGRPKAFDVHVVLVHRWQVQEGEGDGVVQVNDAEQLYTALSVGCIHMREEPLGGYLKSPQKGH